jgi:hypothetical protein
MVFFNPNSPRYQRGVIVAQWAIMAMAGVGVILTNWGTRQHIFSDVSFLFFPVSRLICQCHPCPPLVAMCSTGSEAHYSKD